jgi:hypothetical protein
LSSCQPLLPTGQIWELQLNFRSTAFLWEVCQFQLTTSFSKVVKCVVIFPRLQLCHHHSTQAGSAQHFAPRPSGRVKFSFICLAPSFLQERCNLPISCAELCVSLLSRWHSTHTWKGCSSTLCYWGSALRWHRQVAVRCSLFTNFGRSK